MAVIQITEENFDDIVMKSDKPVLIDFYADWCEPCQMFAPLVTEVSQEQEGRFVVGKVNVDEQPALALKYGVMEIPTLVTMNLGMFAGKSTGTVSKAEILALLEQAEQKRDGYAQS